MSKLQQSVNQNEHLKDYFTMGGRTGNRWLSLIDKLCDWWKEKLFQTKKSLYYVALAATEEQISYTMWFFM